MLAVCSWCGQTIKEEDGVEPIGKVTHGICIPCKLKYFSELEEEDYEVITASQAAELLASVSEDDIQGQ